MDSSQADSADFPLVGAINAGSNRCEAYCGGPQEPGFAWRERGQSNVSILLKTPLILMVERLHGSSQFLSAIVVGWGHFRDGMRQEAKRVPWELDENPKRAFANQKSALYGAFFGSRHCHCNSRTQRLVLTAAPCR